jgi:hypothetical protein
VASAALTGVRDGVPGEVRALPERSVRCRSAISGWPAGVVCRSLLADARSVMAAYTRLPETYRVSANPIERSARLRVWLARRDELHEQR